MYVEDPEATGNEGAPSGELANEQETRAEGPDSREPETETTDWKREFLDKGKPALEEANRLRRENEELRRAMHQPPPAAKGIEEEVDDLSPDEIAALKEASRRGDIYAKAALRDRAEREKDRQEREDLARALTLQREYLDIEDAKERKAVRSRFDPNKHRDLRDAHEELRRESLEAENKRLLAENERLAKGGKPPDPNVTRTHTREVGASEHSRRQPSREEFKARLENLSDDDRRRAMMERRNKLMNQ